MFENTNIINLSESFRVHNMFAVKNRKIIDREDSSEEFDGHFRLQRHSSFNKICQFPISFCQKGSRDFMTWVNGFSSMKTSTIKIIENAYSQVQRSLLYILICIAVLVLGIEICLCLSLLINIIFDTGFVFLLITGVIICSVNLSIVRNVNRRLDKTPKQKSKEI